MLIEITGTSVHNAGAELMLASILRAVREQFPMASFSVDTSFGSFDDRARYGLLLKQEIQRIGRSRLSLALMPASFRRALGVVRDREVRLVLDASGFAFGDQHPVERGEAFATQAERWRARGTRLALLPQALGPFEKPSHRNAFERIAGAADLIYARDKASREHAIAGGADPGRVRLAPDFTVLLEPKPPSSPLPPETALIVPNQRMIDRADDASMAQRYVEWLVAAVQCCREHELEPRLLLHGSDDEPLAERLSSSLSSPVPRIECREPLEAKGVISQCRLLIGSRYHALIGALSQGVPALATSWSHKYEALYEDYGVSHWLLSPGTAAEGLHAAVNDIREHYDQHRAHLRECAAKHRQQTHSMWDEVFQWIHDSVPSSMRPSDP